jgi:hypothetical protein
VHTQEENAIDLLESGRTPSKKKKAWVCFCHPAIQPALSATVVQQRCAGKAANELNNFEICHSAADFAKGWRVQISL